MSDEATLSERLIALARISSIRLTGDQLRQLITYLELLARWNGRMNLTSLSLEGFPPVSLERLLGEPLRAATHLSTPRQWFDLGSGGGSPALPLSIILGDPQLVMVEARARKVAFLREACRVLGLKNARAVGDRIEALVDKAPLAIADLVTIRAVKIDKSIAATVDHLVSPGGRIVIFGQVATAPLPGFISSQPTPELCILTRVSVSRET
jgi:16S rRNA (guanine527-N7)-methyltransferase